MAMIAVSADDVLYRGIHMPLRFIKQVILLNFKPEDFAQFRLDSSKRFNTTDGVIEYKYAWDSVVCHLYAEHNEKFKPILDALVETVNDYK